MIGSAKRRLLCLAFAAFFLHGCGTPAVPTPPEPEPKEDPIVHVLVPGAYGVKGGDKIIMPYSQKSVLLYDKYFSFRIIDPLSSRVVSVSGLPVGLKVGDRISLHYRLSQGGKTLESEVYENVEILMTNDKMAWLKKSDDIFFVIPLL